jgi:hypothetical protein
MKYKAIFIGKDGSLGYSHGKEYELYIQPATCSSGVLLQKRDGCGKCFYQSVVSFLKNWDCIRHI